MVATEITEITEILYKTTPMMIPRTNVTLSHQKEAPRRTMEKHRSRPQPTLTPKDQNYLLDALVPDLPGVHPQTSMTN